jgi:hypothetical protein
MQECGLTLLQTQEWEQETGDLSETKIGELDQGWHDKIQTYAVTF